MHEADDALVRREAEQRPAFLDGRIPVGDPVGAVAECVGSKHEVHRRRAGGQEHFPLRDFRVLLGARHDADHQGSARKTRELLIATPFGKRPFAPLGKLGEFFPDFFAGDAAVENEAPGRQTAMVGHAACDGQHRFDFRIAWRRLAQFGDRSRIPGQQKVDDRRGHFACLRGFLAEARRQGVRRLVA